MSALTCIVLALIASHQDCQPCPTLHPPKMRRILLAAFKSVLLSTMIVNIASETHFHAWHSLTQFCMIAYRSSTVPRYLHDLNMSSSSADPWRLCLDVHLSRKACLMIQTASFSNALTWIYKLENKKGQQIKKMLRGLCIH